VQSGNLEAMAEANQALNAPLGRLLAISEAYPQLKSDANFRALQDELTGTENRIATARQDYNEAVNQFNGYIRRFPFNLTAKMFGHGTPRVYFEAKAGTDEPPAVKFN
jgi:LemA protein